MEEAVGGAPAKKRRTEDPSDEPRGKSVETVEVYVTTMFPLGCNEDSTLLRCRLEHLQQAEGIESVQCNPTADNSAAKVCCGPFLLRASGSPEGCVPPALLWSFACLAAEPEEEPEITFDETDACIGFLRGVLARLPADHSAAVLNDAIAAVEEMVSDSAPLSEEHRVVYTSTQVLSAEECSRMIKLASAHADEKGWSTRRHAAYPTTDLAVGDVQTLAGWVPQAIKERLLPEFESKFGLPSHGLVIEDLFVAKYEFSPKDGSKGQAGLPVHEDGNAWSFVVPLNPPTEYTGGGTQFVELEDSPIFRPEVEGHAVMFSGQNRHCGVQIEGGVRYVLAGFLSLTESDCPVEAQEQHVDEP